MKTAKRANEIFVQFINKILNKNSKKIATMTVYSVGGGAIQIEGQPVELSKDVYKEKSFDEIRAFCAEKRIGYHRKSGCIDRVYSG